MQETPLSSKRVVQPTNETRGESLDAGDDVPSHGLAVHTPPYDIMLELKVQKGGLLQACYSSIH